MGMIFKFRALSDENDSFARDYEVRYDSDLTDLHLLICEDLGFDAGEMASFFLSGPGWEKGIEFTSVPMGEPDDESVPAVMEGTLMGTIIHEPKQRLIYTFDMFSGRSLYLELTGTYKEDPDAVYPLVGFSAGQAPAQFDMGALTEESDSIFDEALGEFSQFEGDDFYDDEF